MRSSLETYMRTVRQHPLLGSEETALTEQYARTRDPQLRRQLVTANLRLVLTIAAGFARRPELLNDLVQEGNLGLLRAVEGYDPHRGVSFASYARWWIRERILKYLLDNHRLVKITRAPTQRKLFYNLRRTERALERNGQAPTAKALAEHLSVPERDVQSMQARLGGSEVSLEGVSTEASRPVEFLASSAELPDVVLERTRLHEKLEGFKKQCSEQESEILRDRLLADEPMTLEALGARRKMSRQTIGKMQNRLLQRLKEYIEGELKGGAK